MAVWKKGHPIACLGMLMFQGKYRYNTKSKASWYWSRSYGASTRLGCQYYVLTDWQRWAFGVFDESR